MLPIGIMYTFLAGLTGLIAGWSAHLHCSQLVFGIRTLAGIKPLAIATSVPQATVTVSEAVPRATATLNHAWVPQQLLLDSRPANKYVRVPVNAVYYQSDVDALLRAATATLAPTGSYTSAPAFATESHPPPRISSFETVVRVPVVEKQCTLATVLIIFAVRFPWYIHSSPPRLTYAQGSMHLTWISSRYRCGSMLHRPAEDSYNLCPCSTS